LGIIRLIAALRSNRHSIRAYVGAIATLILVPALIVVGWLATLWATSERAQLEQAAEHKAREIAADIDREIVSTQNMLTVLASSHFLQNRDLESFHAQATMLTRRLEVPIILLDRGLAQQVVNTAIPWGNPLPAAVPVPRSEDELRSLWLGNPAVSDVFLGRRSDRHVVAVKVPVLRDGAVEFVLSVGCPLAKFAEILDSSGMAPGRIATVLDRRGVVVARSEQHNAYAGRAVAYPPPVGAHGVVKGKDHQGIEFHWFFRRSEATGWSVSVGVPDRLLMAPAKRALASFATAGSLLVAIVFALSYYWAGRLSQSAGAPGIDRKPTREEFEVLFDSVPNGVVVVDSDGLIALANACMEKTFGYGRGELIGQPVELVIPERFHWAHLRLRAPIAGAGRAWRTEPGRELVGRRQDGTEFPIEIGLNPIHTSAGNLVMTTIVDITARKLAEQRICATEAERDDLRRRFMQAQEQERLRLAHELHDQTGQSLTAALLELKGIELLVNERGRERLRLLRRQMEEIGKTLHRVAWELRPASIDELGLASALANYISEWSAQYRIEADFHCGEPGIDSLPEEIRTTIYRVVQEGLTNIAKHARQPAGVSIVIERVGAVLRLLIEDDGCGFDAGPAQEHAAERNSGLGLAGMRERLALIGGELEIESSIGGGTTVLARIPLERERMTA
jgi:two-component system, NarL family, sensor histidine kinase UhpB